MFCQEVICKNIFKKDQNTKISQPALGSGSTQKKDLSYALDPIAHKQTAPQPVFKCSTQVSSLILMRPINFGGMRATDFNGDLSIFRACEQNRANIQKHVMSMYKTTMHILYIRCIYRFMLNQKHASKLGYCKRKSLYKSNLRINMHPYKPK